MKLYIKEKVFSMLDAFKITNEEGKCAYNVTSKFFAVGTKFSLKDNEGTELYLIDETSNVFFRHYTILRRGEKIAKVKVKKEEVNQRIQAQGVDGTYEVKGDFFDIGFDVLKDKKEIAFVKKQVLKLGGGYEIDIQDTKEVGMAVCLSLILFDIAKKNKRD